jgi:hypothetical protein
MGGGDVTPPALAPASHPVLPGGLEPPSLRLKVGDHAIRPEERRPGQD